MNFQLHLGRGRKARILEFNFRKFNWTSGPPNPGPQCQKPSPGFRIQSNPRALFGLITKNTDNVAEVRSFYAYFTSAPFVSKGIFGNTRSRQVHQWGHHLGEYPYWWYWWSFIALTLRWTALYCFLLLDSSWYTLRNYIFSRVCCVLLLYTEVPWL